MSLTCFSQKLLKNNLGDSSICFTIEQSRILLKQINKVSYLDSLINLDQKQIITLEKNLEVCQVINNEKDNQIKIKDDIIEVKNDKLNSEKLNYQNLENLLVVEKIKKWIAITTGTITTSFMTYLWLRY